MLGCDIIFQALRLVVVVVVVVEVVVVVVYFLEGVVYIGVILTFKTHIVTLKLCL